MATSDAQSFAGRRFLADLLDFLFPPKCQVCERHFSGDNIWLCPGCAMRLEIAPVPVCVICRQPLALPGEICPRCSLSGKISWLYSLGGYAGAYSKLIKAFKYGPKPDLGTLLGDLLAQQLVSQEQCSSLDLICPIPLHHRKHKARGFNQAAILAEAIGEALALPVEPEMLLQVRRSKDQIGLSLEERFANVEGVFAVAPEFDLTGASVLLVDDVTTSGATLNDAARALLEAGALSVAAATIAVSHEEGIDFDLAAHFLSDEGGFNG